jgi:NAD-dependent SIR2 family protein deacetylase
MNYFTCKSCRKQKEANEQNTKKNGGIYAKCKECRDYNLVYVELNKDHILKKRQQWKESNKEHISIYNKMYHTN